jgi:hypothetical protein
MSNLRNLFGAVCARFRIPEQGMTEWDVLSRASVMAVDLLAVATKANATRDVAAQFPGTDEALRRAVGYRPLVTSLHVVRPFLFPRYYPEEWLQFVRPKDIRLWLEFRDVDSGELRGEFELRPEVRAHPTLDVALLFVNLDSVTGPKARPRPVARSLAEISMLQGMHSFQLEHDVAEGEELVFGGHVLNDQPHSEACKPRPAIYDGRVTHLLQSEQGLFLAKTETVLQAGMCGGPVLNRRGKCVGLIEGVVQNATASSASASSAPGVGVSDLAGGSRAGSDVPGPVVDGLAAVLPASAVEELLLSTLEGRAGERHHPPHDHLFGTGVDEVAA